MRKLIYAALALSIVVSACGRTPTAPGHRAEVEARIQADSNPADSSAARGGNLMGSGH